jgi:hypothetical protein
VGTRHTVDHGRTCATSMAPVGVTCEATHVAMSEPLSSTTVPGMLLARLTAAPADYSVVKVLCVGGSRLVVGGTA